MPRYDFRTPRLYVDAPLAAGAEVVFDRNQANYLRNVLRLGQGDAVLLFNGRDGEWQGSPVNGAKAQLCRPRPAHNFARNLRLATCIFCLRRSSMRASTTWCRRRWRWGPRSCSR